VSEQARDIGSLGRGQQRLGARSQAEASVAHHLAAVYRLSDPDLVELSLDQLLKELVGRVQEILSVDTVAILLLDESRRGLIPRAARGLEAEVELAIRIPVGRGFAGRVAAQRHPIFIEAVSEADVVNPILREARIASLLGVPLVTHGQVLGVLHVGSLRPRRFTDDDAALLQLAASRAAPAIERAMLLDDLEREREDVVALQRSLLPAAIPAFAGLDVAASYLPASDVIGGDWYDVVDLGAGQVVLVIGDIAGHGVRASTRMGQLRMGLRAYVLEGHRPADALTLLNRLLHSLGQVETATALCVAVDTTSGDVEMASAGHPPPIVIDRAARYASVQPGPPLGAVSGFRYRSSHDGVGPGGSLVLFTDGLIERRDAALEERMEQLRRAAEAVAPASAEQMIDALLAAMGVDERASDDVALVTLRRIRGTP